MKIQHTDEHTFLLDSDIEVWLEPDAYCPRVFIKKPKNIKKSHTVLSQTMVPYQQIIKGDEFLFIEDIVYNLFRNPKFSNEVKLKTARQLKELAKKMEKMIEERIEEDQLDDEYLWRDYPP